MGGLFCTGLRQPVAKDSVAMQIAKNSVVTFKYDLKVDDEDDVIDSDELTS
jgi:hypothetical protein